MAKRKIVEEVTFTKGTMANKEDIKKIIDRHDEVVIHSKKYGKYDDGKEFITITIDNV